MIKEPIHRGSKDTRNRPKEGQRPNRVSQQGYMQPSEAGRTQGTNRMPAIETPVPRRKSALRRALPYIIAGGSTGAAIGGFGLFSFLS